MRYTTAAGLIVDSEIVRLDVPPASGDDVMLTHFGKYFMDIVSLRL